MTALEFQEKYAGKKINVDAKDLFLYTKFMVSAAFGDKAISRKEADTTVEFIECFITTIVDKTDDFNLIVCKAKEYDRTAEKIKKAFGGDKEAVEALGKLCDILEDLK